MPTHRFFGLCDAIARDADDFVVAQQMAFFETGRDTLASRKRQQKLLSYDDLLTRLATDGRALLAE